MMWLLELIQLVAVCGFIALAVGLLICAISAPKQTMKAIYRIVRAVWREYKKKK